MNMIGRGECGNGEICFPVVILSVVHSLLPPHHLPLFILSITHPILSISNVQKLVVLKTPRALHKRNGLIKCPQIPFLSIGMVFGDFL